MFSFHNITANNGWAMAAVGASIVFSGLVILSFAISQIHKLLALWDERAQYFGQSKKQGLEEETKVPGAPAYSPPHIPPVDELARIYRPLAKQLKEPFDLIQLFEKTKEMDIPHPHLSIKRLREAGYLLPQQQDLFIWNKQKDN